MRNLDGDKRAPHDWYGFEHRGDRPHDDEDAGHVVVGTTLAGTYCPTVSGALLRALLGIEGEAA